MKRIARAWSAYWLAPGGRYASAAVRIGIALSLLWMLWRYQTAWAHESSRYYQLGPWLLYPDRPGPGLLAAITVVAWGATLAMLAGAWSRASHAVATLACTLIAAHGVSEGPTWSHIDVPPLLASIAFLGTPSGAVWSIEAWRRRRRGEGEPAVRQTGVRLVLVTVVSVFFVAGFWKLRADGFGLGWALSDNLRHQILARFDWIGLPRTELADWIVAESWRYRTVASLNLVSQIVPIAAVFLHRYPRLRACIGVLFVLEVIGLAAVMDLWDLHWLPLAAVFVDWDALVARVTKPAPAPEPLARSRGARAHLAYATVFLVFYGLHAFWLNQRTRLFPFSSFPMFSEVRAKQPYGVHQSYELLGGHIELFGARPLDPDKHAWLAHHGGYRWMWRARTPAVVRSHLTAILTEMRRAWPELELRTARLSLAVFQAPAYPAPARLERQDLAILGELDADGTLRTLLGALGRDGRTIAVPPGVEIARAYASIDLSPALIELPITGNVLDAPLVVGDPAYLVVETRDGRRWLAGHRSSRRW